MPNFYIASVRFKATNTIMRAEKLTREQVINYIVKKVRHLERWKPDIIRELVVSLDKDIKSLELSGKDYIQRNIVLNGRIIYTYRFRVMHGV